MKKGDSVKVLNETAWFCGCVGEVTGTKGSRFLVKFEDGRGTYSPEDLELIEESIHA